VANGDEPLTSPVGVAVQLLRMVLVYEETDDLTDPNGVLSLLPNAPRRWFRDGERISVADAPTFYGTVGFDVQSHAAQGQIEARISARWHEPPKMLRIRLRHPDGKPIQSATIEGRGPSRCEEEWVYLPGDVTNARVVAHY
jgi:hypothetical protein